MAIYLNANVGQFRAILHFLPEIASHSHIVMQMKKVTVERAIDYDPEIDLRHL